MATVCTTTYAGAAYAGNSADPWIWWFLSGWVFSVPLMTILLAHELGHFFAGRRHGLWITLPYFIPFMVPIGLTGLPVPLLGTFGAFIKIRSPIGDKRALVDVGAAGPLVGSLFAIPLLLLGLVLSELGPLPSEPQGISITFGSSIILELFCLLRFGDFWFNVWPVMNLHPTALAAWFGLFVTALNLLPMGQLDGGHVIHALFGSRRARIVSRVTLVCLVGMGIVFWPGWLVFGILACVLGLRHPEPLDPYTPLDRSGRFLAWAAIVLFALILIPVPISISE